MSRRAVPADARVFFRVLCAFSGFLGALTALGEAPMPAEMPKTVLCAPLNATYAANHLQYWRDKGFDGFIFYGIWDWIGRELPIPQEGKAEEPPVLREMRLANEHLCEAALNRNFLYVALEPEDKWFVPWGQMHAAEARFRTAGEFCRKAGLRGIAFDLRPDNLVHDFRWDGYNLAITPPEQLREGARDFGRRVLRAFIGAYPDAEVLFLADSLKNAGPLCLDLLDGLIESVGMASGIPLRLLTAEEPSAATPKQFFSSASSTQHFILNHLTPENQQRWKNQGGVAMGLKPFGYREGKPVQYRTLEEFRVLWAAAKAVSTGYVWVDGREGGWWSLDAREAQSYGPLLQGGPAAIMETPSWPAEFGRFSVKTPLDDYVRVGACKDADLFGGQDGVAAVYWSGLKESMVIPERNAAVPVVLLRSGEQRLAAVAEGKAVLEPFQEPVVIKTLPFRTWGLPACLWMEAETELTPKKPRAPLRFGFSNRSELSVEGMLEVTAPRKFSIGKALFSVETPAGGNVSFQRTLQGLFHLDRPMDFRMTFAVPGGSLIERTFTLEAAPALEWAVRADAGPVDGLAVTDFEGDRIQEILFASARGDIHCVDALGSLKWEQRFSAGFQTAPVPGRAKGGTAAVAVADRKGNLHVFNGQGAVLGSLSLGAACVPGALLFSNLTDQNVDTVVAGLTDRRIVFLPGGTEAGWEYRAEGKVHSLGCAAQNDDLLYPTVRGNIYTAIGKPKNELLCLDVTGVLRWRVETQARPGSRPYVMHPGTEDPYLVALGMAEGKIQAWKAVSGVPLWKMETGSEHPVTELLFADVDPAAGLELLAVDAEYVYCFSAERKRLWRTKAPGAHGLAVHVLEGEPCIVTGGDMGVMYGFGAGGRLRWRDTRAAGASLGTPIFQDTDADRRVECLFASEDRFVRSLELGPIKTPVLPREAQALGR